jgi:hypothetical protein
MEIRLRFDEEGHETVIVAELAPGRFRLEVTPLLGADAIYAGDVIEAHPLRDGTHQFRRVVQRAPLRHWSWLVPCAFVESPRYQAFTTAVEATGGSWESMMGGLLIVHMPEEMAFEAEKELERHLASIGLAE